MGKETSASTEHGTQTGGEGVGADLPGCSGFGNPVSDGVCIFHGELEATEEVTGIMNLLRSYLSNCVERASKDGLRIRVIGDRSALDADIVEMLEHAERETAKFDKLDFTIALNYGGRDELRRTMTKLAKQVQEGTLAPEAITEDVIAKHLDTADLPDPDLLIRTSGELRLSNYLIWQLAYAEFYFTDTLWPDFDKESLKEAIRYYNGRERRFGGVK